MNVTITEEKLFDNIRGKVIAAWVTNNDSLLGFLTKEDGGGCRAHLYHADADCCSTSFFHSFTGVDELVGARVLDVEVGPDEETHPPTRQEVDLTRTISIVTDKGNASFKMTNSSNGYYSGWISYAGSKIESWMNGQKSLHNVRESRAEKEVSTW